MTDILATVTPLLDRYATQLIAEDGGPAYALAITDRNGTIAFRRWGTLTPESTTAPNERTLFEIGSIGKSFTAIVLLQLAAEGHVDLHAPIADQLPLWRIPSPFAPITPHMLLTHTSGLGGGSDHVPAPEHELWLAQGAPVALAPNTAFVYSNLGYKALGLLIEHVTGQPYADVVRQRIFAPLAMHDAEGAITSEIRHRLAPGHVPAFDDRPHLRRHGLVPATWLETNTADGCLAMSAPNLATYLRMLLNRGAADDGTRILTDAQFATMIAPHTGETPMPTYGYGLGHETEESIERIGHSGGMVGWLSDMTGDLATGLGVVVLHNGAGSPSRLAGFALNALLAAHRGDPLPDVPATTSETAIANAADYLGVYEGSGRVEVIPHDGGIALVRDGETFPLLHPCEGDAFVLDRPVDDRFALVFQRNDGQQVTGITHGPHWYANDRDTSPRDAATPDAWAAGIGHYRSYNPWLSNLRVIARRGTLYVVFGGRFEVPLTPEGDAFTLTDPRTPAQTIRFDPVVGGRTLALHFADGTMLTRVFTE